MWFLFSCTMRDSVLEGFQNFSHSKVKSCRLWENVSFLIPIKKLDSCPPLVPLCLAAAQTVYTAHYCKISLIFSVHYQP